MTAATVTPPPVALAIGGHDPSGGAGLSADIQTLTQLRCHPASVVTALTVQDTRGVHSYECVPVALATQQCQVVLNDLPVRVVKTGMFGCAALAEAMAALLAKTALPIVVDPVLAAGSGDTLAAQDLAQVLISALLPLARIATPNTSEALQLTGAAETAAAAQRMLATGCDHVLLTATDSSSAREGEVVHHLYSSGQAVREIRCPRLPGVYHGSGCTLASAIAAYLAHGAAVADAVERAQAYTFAALKSAYRLGAGQALPNRIGRNAD